MNDIKILPDNLINQISAGEVVERPSSVIKELIENSIDAGATAITIEIENGGKSKIVVLDNGTGIKKEDLPLAIERHATSKIKTVEDLFKISTMGFRGEALASIASVSKLIISSRTSGFDNGYKLKVSGGKSEDIEVCGMPNGTKIEVENLFYNTPARLKYLKTDSTEVEHCSRYITEISLCFNYIHFKLIIDGKVAIDLPAVNDHFQRVSQVFGPNLAKEMLPVQWFGSEIKIEGFVGKPSVARASKASQYLFINDRPVESTAISKAVQIAYSSLLPAQKFPIYILQISLPFEKIDVNVHPRKKEVRFINQSEIFSAVQSAIKKLFETSVMAPSIEGQERSYWNTENLFNETAQSQSSTIQDSLNFANQFEREFSRLHTSTGSAYNSVSKEQYFSVLEPLCQIANSYILAKDDRGLIVIDQHAAHERVMYEMFLGRSERSTTSQPLLSPLAIDLLPHEKAILEREIKTLQKTGFEIESFGGNTFTITSVPSPLKDENIEKILKDVLQDLSDGTHKSVQEPEYRMICYMACRGAVKFGQALSMEEMRSLLQSLSKVKNPHTCPHGRPTHLSLSLSELEKRFGRK